MVEERYGCYYFLLHALISFPMSPIYKDEVMCDVLPVDACHLLLGQPWKCDRQAIHVGQVNTYNFIFCGTKIFLLRSKDKGVSLPLGDSINP